MRYFLCFLIPVFLIGCTAVKNPNPVGRGYASYNKEYKVAPGPKPDSMGYAYSEETNAEVLGVWSATVVDLVDQLEATGSFVPQSVYVVPHAQGNGFYTTFDHVLREELTARGYSLSENGIPLHYMAAHPPGQFAKDAAPVGTISKEPPANPDYRDVVLSLSLGPPDAPVAGVSESYFLPQGDFSYLFEAWDTSTPPTHMNP